MLHRAMQGLVWRRTLVSEDNGLAVVLSHCKLQWRVSAQKKMGTAFTNALDSGGDGSSLARRRDGVSGPTGGEAGSTQREGAGRWVLGNTGGLYVVAVDDRAVGIMAARELRRTAAQEV